MQVQTRFAQGLWLHLNFGTEARYWLGKYEPRGAGSAQEGVRSRIDLLQHSSEPRLFFVGGDQLHWPGGHGVCLRPEPANCLRLKQMAIRNQLRDRIGLVETAAWSRTSPEGLPFRRGGRRATYGGVLADGVAPVLADGKLCLSSTVSVDDFWLHGNPAPDVLKIDVEGGSAKC